MPKVIVEQDYNHTWPSRAVTCFRASPKPKMVKVEVARGLVDAGRGRIVEGDEADALTSEAELAAFGEVVTDTPPQEAAETPVEPVADGSDSQ